jgi:hypothetical protein
MQADLVSDSQGCCLSPLAATQSVCEKAPAYLLATPMPVQLPAKNKLQPTVYMMYFLLAACHVEAQYVYCVAA